MKTQPAPRNRVLILGGSSYIGRVLASQLGARAVATYRRHAIPGGIAFDSLKDDFAGLIKDSDQYSHAVIFLGETHPDRCAENIEQSHALNVGSICRIIDVLKQRGIKPVFASTEFVFDGIKGNYVETDKPNPILTYGRQKLEVEHYLHAVLEDFIIVRFAKVFGSGRDDGTLFTAWLQQIEQGDTIRCARDQVFSPIHVDDVARAVCRLIDSSLTGIFHVAGRRACNRLDLLNLLLITAQAHLKQTARIQECSIDDFGLLEQRPHDVSLNPHKLLAALGMVLPDIEQGCQRVVAAYFNEA